MRTIYYIMAAIVGLFAILSLLGGVESVLAGAIQPLRFLVAVVGLALCYIWIRRARAAK